MGSLGDAFPDEFRRAHSELTVECGLVVVLDDEIAEKRKYHIIVGFDDDKVIAATVRINSKINMNFYSRPELKELLHNVSSGKYDFLEHDSFVACDKIIQWRRDQIVNLITANPEMVLGQIEIDELEIIQYKISTADTISANLKKKYGLFIKEA